MKLTEKEQIKFAKWLKHRKNVYNSKIPKRFNINMSGSSKYFSRWYNKESEDKDGYKKYGEEYYYYLSDENSDALNYAQSETAKDNRDKTAIVISIIALISSLRAELTLVFQWLMQLLKK